MAPYIESIEVAVRTLSLPTIVSLLIWAVRKYDAGQRDFKALVESTQTAVGGIANVQQRLDKIESNHLAHLQSGIEEVSKSNTEAVTVLREISQGITVLIDRTPRT